MPPTFQLKRDKTTHGAEPARARKKNILRKNKERNLDDENRKQDRRAKSCVHNDEHNSHSDRNDKKDGFVDEEWIEGGCVEVNVGGDDEGTFGWL